MYYGHGIRGFIQKQRGGFGEREEFGRAILEGERGGEGFYLAQRCTFIIELFFFLLFNFISFFLLTFDHSRATDIWVSKEARAATNSLVEK